MGTGEDGPQLKHPSGDIMRRGLLRPEENTSPRRAHLGSAILFYLFLAGGLRPRDPPISRPPASPKIWPKMAVVGPETWPNGPGLSWDSVFRPEQPKRTRPGQLRPRFGPRPKVHPGQKLDFSLEADLRFMGPSWVGANGLIFGKVYIVWVCAPGYRPLSCRRNRIRENRT